MLSDCRKSCFQVRVIAAHDSLVISSSPRASDQVCCEIDVGFLFVEVIDLNHLQLWGFGDRLDQPLERRCREYLAFNDGNLLGIHFAQRL